MAEINSDRIILKTAAAFAALIKKGARGPLAGVQIIATQTNVEKEAARVEVGCHTATMEKYGSTWTGNYWADVEIHVITHHNDTDRATAEAMYGQIREMIMQDDLMDQMNALSLPDFSIMGAPGQLGTSLDNVREGMIVNGDANEDIFAFSVYVAPCNQQGSEQ